MDNDDKIELLTDAGKAMFGSNWKTEFSRNFDINERSVRYWSTGERTIPDSIIRAVISMLRQRADLMHREADHICKEIRFTDSYKELKINWLQSMKLANFSDVDWFDVDGYVYGLTRDDQVINVHGAPSELKNATVAELRAKMQSVIDAPGYGEY